MTSPSIVFTEQFYYPEGWGGAQLPRDVTIHLARGGARVEVICGGDQYAPFEDDEPVEDPRGAGVIIRRTPRLLSGNIHHLKLLKQLIFYAAVLPRLLLRRRPDAFVTQTNPPLLVPMVAAVAWVHRCPLIVIAQDIYPEVMFAHGMAQSNGLAGRLLAGLFRWAYRRATRVVSLGPVMSRRLTEKGVRPERISIISNWATGDTSIERGAANTLRARWGLQGCFVILYSGNVGIAHDVETPIEALRLLLARNPQVRLVFVGKGSRLKDAQRLAGEAGVAHAVQFRPLVPAAELPQSIGLAQLALVTLREGFEGLVVPSKLLGYMARAVPTLYAGPYSDIEQMLNDSNGGLSFRNREAEAMARGVQALIDSPTDLDTLGRSAKAWYEQHLSAEQGLRLYGRLIAETVKVRSAAIGSHPGHGS